MVRASLRRALATLVACGAIGLVSGCGKSAAPPAPAAEPTVTATAAGTAAPRAPAATTPAANPGPRPAAPVTGNLVGLAGLAAWDALPPAEKASIKAYPSLFLHQSVGQDLEDGAAELGFSFAYYGPKQASVSQGLNGGIFTDVSGLSNGEPKAKVAAFQAEALKHTGKLRVAIMKFGYADVTTEFLPQAQASYKAAVATLTSKGIRIVHVTPPLVFEPSENPPKAQLRQWMLSSFPGDVIYDFQTVESTDQTGKPCIAGGAPQICPDVRSRIGCASKGQGIDGPGQGHLCQSAATRLAKGLLYAVYLAGKR